VQKEVAARGIQHVFHFTKLENLDSILKHGIVPREILERKSIKHLQCDTSRLDGEIAASCFSISHPNYKMFYTLRKQDKNQEWAVIGCDASVLWKKDCAFCCANAASNSVTSIPLADRKGAAAFEAIFAPVAGKPSRSEIKLPDKCPTNPQAEVLIFDVVEPKFFVGIAVRSEELKKKLSLAHPQASFLYNENVFSARFDFRHWK
jgi:ssDNA thymidine ADP-ribosyltransferase, DarT